MVAGLALALLVGVGAGVGVARLGAPKVHRLDMGPTLGVYPGEPGMTGRELLLAMAEQLADRPDDERTGTYAHLLVITWGPEIQGPVRAVRQETWRTTDGLTSYAEQRARDIPASGFDLATTSHDFSGVVPMISVRESYEPASADVELPGLAEPGAELTAYLEGVSGGGVRTPRVRIDELVGLTHRQHVPLKMRVGVLRMLAALAGVEFAHERTSDNSGRPGIAFTATTDAESKEVMTLWFDPVTAHLLAVQTLVDGTLFAYQLFTPSNWTDHVGSPEPTRAATGGPGSVARTPVVR